MFKDKINLIRFIGNHVRTFVITGYVVCESTRCAWWRHRESHAHTSDVTHARFHLSIGTLFHCSRYSWRSKYTILLWGVTFIYSPPHPLRPNTGFCYNFKNNLFGTRYCFMWIGSYRSVNCIKWLHWLIADGNYKESVRMLPSHRHSIEITYNSRL